MTKLKIRYITKSAISKYAYNETIISKKSLDEIAKLLQINTSEKEELVNIQVEIEEEKE